MVSTHYWEFPFGVGPVVAVVAVLPSPVGDLEVISALVSHGCQWIGSHSLAISFELSLLPLLALMGVRFGDGKIGQLGSSGDRSHSGSDLFSGACVTIPSVCRIGGVERRS